MIKPNVILFVVLSALEGGAAPPEGAFKNLEKVRARYEKAAITELKNLDVNAQNEFIWMSNASSRVKNYNSFTTDEINRVWGNYHNGKPREKALGFSMIASIEPLKKWLPDLKNLINSDNKDDQMLAFSVIDAYSRNDYGRFRNKEIFADPEILEIVENYTEQFKDKDKYFQARVEKMQDSVAEISQNLNIRERNPKDIERLEKAIPNGGENTSQSNNEEASETSKVQWLWAIGILLLVAMILFIMRAKTKR